MTTRPGSEQKSKPFTADEIKSRERDHRGCRNGCEYSRYLATINDRDERLHVATMALTMIRDAQGDAFPDEIATRALEAMR
jgi:hypothetical protein